MQTLKAYACYYIIVREKQEGDALQGKPEAEDSIKAEKAVISVMSMWVRGAEKAW